MRIHFASELVWIGDYKKNCCDLIDFQNIAPPIYHNSNMYVYQHIWQGGGGGGLNK